MYFHPNKTLTNDIDVVIEVIRETINDENFMVRLFVNGIHKCNFRNIQKNKADNVFKFLVNAYS